MGVHLCSRCLQPRQNAESGLYASSFSISLGRSVSKRQKTGVWIPEFLQKRSDLKPNGPAQAVGKGTSSRQPSFFRILLVSNGVLLVATEANWICGLDPFSGTVLWSRNLGPAWNVADVGCGDLTPIMGITGTPVIDADTGTAYFLNKTYCSGNSGPAIFFMHAVDVKTGTERPNFPVAIAGTAQNDSTSTFDATKLNNRTALLLIYGAFGALCDIGSYKE